MDGTGGKPMTEKPNLYLVKPEKPDKEPFTNLEAWKAIADIFLTPGLSKDEIKKVIEEMDRRFLIIQRGKK
jgi:hypothetical protein